MLWVREKLAASSSGQCWKMQLGCLQGKMPWHKVIDKGYWSQSDKWPFRNTWLKCQNAPISFYNGIMLPVTQREWAKPWELLCMHVVGKSNRGAACCLASGPSRQKETKLKVNFMLWFISALSHLPASLPFLFASIRSSSRHGFSPKPGWLICIPLSLEE